MSNPDQSDNRLTSERIKAFEEALELLYIKGNLGGRIKFFQEWSAPALYMFGEELITMDRVGTKDRQRRAALENEAEDRRINLLETVTSLEEKSAERGVMNLDYIRNTINHYGRVTSLLMYATKVVDKILPPAAGEQEEVIPQRMPESSANYEISENEITIGAIRQHPLMKEPDFEAEPEEESAPQANIDHMDDIVPISVGQQAPTAPSIPIPPPIPEPLPEETRNVAPVPPLRPSSPVAPVMHQPPVEEKPDPDKPFVPKAFGYVEPEDEPPPTKPGKLKIFGIKDSSDKKE